MQRALVVGAGVYGLAAARELHARGWGVTLVEPGPIPRPEASSTDRSKVIRADYGADDFLSGLAAESLERWRLWNATLFSRPLYHETGFLLLSRGPMEPGGFEADSLACLERHGARVMRIDADDLARLFPAWNTDVYRAGYVSRDGGWAESGEVVRQLAARALTEGVAMVAGRVTRIESTSPPSIVLEDGRELEADAVVVAAGAWTPGLMPDLAASLKPVAIPVVLLRPHDPAPYRAERFPAWGADIARTGRYGFPVGDDGIVKIGYHGQGSAGDPEAPEDVPALAVERCRAFLRESIPSLADAPLAGTRHCFYCDAMDGDFWITRHPDMEGVVVSSGGSGHGFKFAPVLGELAANAVEGVQDQRLERFRWRSGARPGREAARYDG